MLPASQYASASVTDLLNEAAHGRVGIDQRWLKAILDRGPAAAPEVIAFARKFPETARLDLGDDLIAMLRFWKAPEALDYYLDFLRANPDEVPDDVHFALQEIGATATPRLIDLYNELGEEQGGEIAFALATIRPRDPRVLTLLSERLEYDMEDAALALGLYGDTDAKPVLEKYLAEDPGNPYVTDALAELGKTDEPAGASEEFDIWRVYPDVSSPDVSVLSVADRLALLQEGTTAEDRVAAAESFFGDELEDKAYQLLRAAAETDADMRVRGAAWKVLGGNIRDRKEVHGWLWAKLKDEAASLEERGGALVGLAFGADDDALTEPFVKQFYENVTSRRDAMEAMWRSNDKRWAGHFMKHLDDADLELQKAAIRGIGLCQIRGEANRLKQFFGDEELRSDALYAYALAVPSDPSPSRMRSLLKRIDAEAGLSENEREFVMMALDERMELAGKPPVFLIEEDEDDQEGHDHGPGGHVH